MPAINRLLTSGDSEVLSHACSALSHLCDGSAAHIKVLALRDVSVLCVAGVVSLFQGPADHLKNLSRLCRPHLFERVVHVPFTGRRLLG